MDECDPRSRSCVQSIEMINLCCLNLNQAIYVTYMLATFSGVHVGKRCKAYTVDHVDACCINIATLLPTFTLNMFVD